MRPPAGDWECRGIFDTQLFAFDGISASGGLIKPIHSTTDHTTHYLSFFSRIDSSSESEAHVFHDSSGGSDSEECGESEMEHTSENDTRRRQRLSASNSGVGGGLFAGLFVRTAPPPDPIIEPDDHVVDPGLEGLGETVTVEPEAPAATSNRSNWAVARLSAFDVEPAAKAKVDTDAGVTERNDIVQGDSTIATPTNNGGSSAASGVNDGGSSGADSPEGGGSSGRYLAHDAGVALTRKRRRDVAAFYFQSQVVASPPRENEQTVEKKAAAGAVATRVVSSFYFLCVIPKSWAVFWMIDQQI